MMMAARRLRDAGIERVLGWAMGVRPRMAGVLWLG